MINEVIEVRSYLDGKNLSKKNLYRICYLLAKWFKEKGLAHMEIRNAVFEWAGRHNIHIKYNLNGIIYRAAEDKSRLKDNAIIKINQGDVDEINSRFDSKNTKLVALAVLCYAKAYANRDKIFSVSSTALSEWVKISVTSVSGRHMKELCDFGYISKIPPAKNGYAWAQKDMNNMYRLNVDIHNNGGYVLADNNILDLYSEIFS